MALGGFTGSNAEAEVDYVNASTDVFLDYDSKNREFYFSVPLADAHEFVIVKPALSDVLHYWMLQMYIHLNHLDIASLFQIRPLEY